MGKKKRPASKKPSTGGASMAQRVAHLEARVEVLEEGMKSFAQFVAYGVAHQLQEHLIAHPEDREKLEAAAASPGTAGEFPFASPFLPPEPAAQGG